MKFARRFSRTMPSNPSPPYATSFSRQSSISSEIPTSLNPSLLSPTSSGHCDMEVVSGSRSCEEDEGWPAGSAAFGAGGHLRWDDPHRGGEDWRRDAADHPRLGDAV